MKCGNGGNVNGLKFALNFTFFSSGFVEKTTFIDKQGGTFH